MTASQPDPGWELQPRTHTAEDVPSRSSRRGDSLRIEHGPLSTNRSFDHGEPRTPKEQATWASNASSSTVGMTNSPSDTTPRWPFVEPEEQQQPSKEQRQPHRRQPVAAPIKPSHSRHVLRYWGLEIAAVIVAVLLLIAIIALLAHYDGHYMPDWPFDITLNSAIAFLTTFLRAAIVAAVAEIIGQIKWTWFTERTRPLHHLQDFDAASRSVLGSLRLLFVVMWNMGFTSAGLLGIGAALVTIASLAVGPVTQQALRTGTCAQLMPDARSAVPAANFVPGTTAYYRTGAGSYELEVDMKSTMIQGLTDPGGKDSDVVASCSSGNCTWPDWGTGVTHASIGLCSACLDTTDFVSAPDLGGNMTLPDEGAFINYNPGGGYMWVGYSNLSAYGHLFDEDFATAASVSVSNFSMLLTTKAPCTMNETTGMVTSCPHKITQSNLSYFDNLGDYVAASCVLYPCMKEYSAYYRNNTLREKVVKTTTAIRNTAETTNSYSAYANYTAVKSPCVLDNGTWYDYHNQSEAKPIPGRTWANISLSDQLRGVKNFSVPNACLYKMDGIFFNALSGFLSQTLLYGSCSYSDEMAGHISCGDAWWLTPLWGDMNATFASLDGAVRELTVAVTNKFRMTGFGPDHAMGAAAPARGEAYGDVYGSTTCTYFDPGWVALPAALVATCVVLLAWVAVKNYRDPEQPVWKGSVLPLLFFGLHAPGAPGANPRLSGAAGDTDRLERNATFFRENGRAAPELDRIQEEAGKMRVRFHGGTDPGFVDLGTVGRGSGGRPGDPEASVEALVSDRTRRESLWPEYKTSPLRRSTRRGSA